MPYAIVELELTEPLPTVALADDEDGALLLARVHGRPVHHVIVRLPRGARVRERELVALLGPDAPAAALEDALRRELAPPPAATPVDVTAAICTRARPELLEACLRSLAAAGLPGGSNGAGARREVLVVDNAPPDDATRRLVAAHPGVRYALEPRAGLDFARNRAVAETRTAWVAFLDDDVAVDPGWAAGLDEAVAEQPDAAAVTGAVLPLELRTPAQIAFESRGGFGRGYRKRRFAGRELPGDPVYPLGAGIFGAGANMAFRTDVVRELGGFDEALDTGPPLPGGGDLDMFFRVVHAGHALAFEPSMLVRHRHRPDDAGLRRQYWSWGEGFMAFLDKTVRAHPEVRPKAVRLLGWWLRYEAREAVKSARHDYPLTPDLALAELTGGLVGLAGTYRRSQRRVERIRAAHA
jgi:GT2 family glycosyltransferase